MSWVQPLPVLPQRSSNDRRSASEEQGPIYIFIYDIQRFRDLRKSDDDFGYARYDEDKPVPPSKSFSDVLRDGPPVGVHTIIWCDSVNNLNRTLDRQGMKEFENRILFQMSANDSSTLIDNPAASKLGENRALYYSEEAEPGREVPAVRSARARLARGRETAVQRPSPPGDHQSTRRGRQWIGCATRARARTRPLRSLATATRPLPWPPRE